MKNCSNCGAALQDDTQFCMNCGAAATAEAAPVVAEAAAPKKKGKGKLIGLICGGVALLAIIAFVIIGFATNWFRGPLGEIKAALEKTMKANSFTMELEMKGKSNNSSNTNKTAYEYQVVLDREKRDAVVLVIMNLDDNEYQVLQAEGKSYTLIINDGDTQHAAIEDLEKDVYENLFKVLNNEYETDDEALEEILEKYEIKADAGEVRDFIKTLEKDCLDNQEWLEEFLGFEKKKDKYTFEIDVDDLIKDIAERAYEADIISKSQKKDWTSAKTNQKYEIEIGLKDGYIAEFEILMETEYTEVTYAIELSDINETEISNKEKNGVIDKVNAYIEEYCAYCKGCNEMDKKDWMYYADENYYCSDCYHLRSYCDGCSHFFLDDDLQYIDYNDYCSDCYDEYIAEYYTSCTDCNTEFKKSNGYYINEKYYCYDCRWDREYCDACSDFVKKDEITRISGSYNDYCKKCYAEYATTHTCDLCGTVTGTNYICFEHSVTGNCGQCNDHTTLNYYNVQTKKHICWWCY